MKKRLPNYAEHKSMAKPKKRTPPKARQAALPEAAQSPAEETAETQSLTAASSTVPTAPKPQSLAEILQDKPVYVNSIAAGLLGLDRGAVLRELQHARA